MVLSEDNCTDEVVADGLAAVVPEGIEGGGMLAATFILL